MSRFSTCIIGAALATSLVLGAAVPVVASDSVAASEPPPSYVDSLVIAGGYHRELSLLHTRYFDQPERAAYEFERLTAGALEEQQQIEVHPCFAEWWSYELMGLELASLSHELRTEPLEQNPEADAVERLGTRMWARAMSLVPGTSEACGLVPPAIAPQLVLTVTPGELE